MPPRSPAETVPHAQTSTRWTSRPHKSGPRARVKEVQLKNGTEYRDAEILSRLKMKPGRELTSARIQRGTERIRKFLVKKGHLKPARWFAEANTTRAKNTIPLELEVTEGPRVRDRGHWGEDFPAAN